MNFPAHRVLKEGSEYEIDWSQSGHSQNKRGNPSSAWVLSPTLLLGLIAMRGTYEMPTAAREPRGMLAAGSLRSPPMLKPAMTPERHPDGE